MLKNYLKIALRNLSKNKIYSFINISGLAMGILCCLLVLVYVRHEWSYDRYHEKAGRIFRVIENSKTNGVGEESTSGPNELGPTLINDFPDLIEQSVRFFNMQVPALALEYGDKKFHEKRFFFADSNVLKVFSWTLFEGDRRTALQEPNTILITRETARRYFGDEDAVGKTIRFEGKIDLKVTGVLNDIPSNSHFQFDILCSFGTTRGVYPKGIPGYGTFYWNPSWTYVLLKEGAKSRELEARFPLFVKKYFKYISPILWLQPVTDIHLHSNLDFEIEANSDATYLYIFSVIAFLILLIACVNFVNLSTARAGTRMKEVGMRKAIGAQRWQLVRQFLSESLFISFLAAVLAVALFEPALPFFNYLVGKDLHISFAKDFPLLYATALLVLVVGIAAGAYPAFYLSRFEPAKVLKGAPGDGSYRSLFREILVVVQFAISILLIIGTLTANRQLQYMKNIHLGFNKEFVVMIPTQRTPAARNFDEFKNALQQHSAILSVTATEDIVGWKYQTGGYHTEKMSEKEEAQLPRLIVGYDFSETFGIPLAAGRSFSKDFPADVKNAVMINETAARYLGWNTPQEALNQKFTNNGGSVIIGVVKDFNFTSLHQKIDPLVLEFSKRIPGMWDFVKYTAVKINPADPDAGVRAIGDTWKQFCGNLPFEYFFLDEDLDKMYRAEQALGNISLVLSGLTILIACMGLFGLAAFTAERRTKEIGVRKVLGASVTHILLLLSKDFLRLILVANLIAWPTAYLVARAWLNDFAYQTEIGWSLFVIAAVVAVVIAMTTLSFQVVRAATANPVRALKYE